MTELTMAGFASFKKIKHVSYIYDSHTSDYSNRVQVAADARGNWYRRYQIRTQRGYRWGTWRLLGNPPDLSRATKSTRVARLAAGGA